MTNVPLFVNGEGMRGGKVHHSIEGLPFLGEASTPRGTGSSPSATSSRGSGRWPRGA